MAIYRLEYTHKQVLSDSSEFYVTANTLAQARQILDEAYTKADETGQPVEHEAIDRPVRVLDPDEVVDGDSGVSVLSEKGERILEYNASEMRRNALGNMLVKLLDNARTVDMIALFWADVAEFEAGCRREAELAKEAGFIKRPDADTLIRTASKYGYQLMSRTVWETMDATPAQKHRMRLHQGSFIIWDGSDSEDGWMIVGDDMDDLLNEWWDLIGCTIEEA